MLEKIFGPEGPLEAARKRCGLGLGLGIDESMEPKRQEAECNRNAEMLAENRINFGDTGSCGHFRGLSYKYNVSFITKYVYGM